MGNSVAVYIHYPYCLSKCRYCAFASAAVPCRDLTGRYLAEWAPYAGRTVSSVYFGGGTPSLMEVSSVAAILEKLQPSGEVTLEANPATISLSKMRSLRAAGVNRLSLGIQSLDDAELGWLGRAHTAREALALLDDARRVFENVNADFIYGLPLQTVRDWKRALWRIVALDLPHYSLYQLSHERGTPLARLAPVSESVAAAMFALAPRILRQYEVSNFAKPGFEGRHNLNYWRGGEYVGLGPSAAGRVKIGGKWSETKDGRVRPLSRLARAREMVISGLRMNAGVDFATFKANSGVDFWDVVSRVRAQGLLITGARGVRVRAKFRPLLDSVVADIVL